MRKSRESQPGQLPGSDAWWQAVLERDPRQDGRFVLGVRTTGIYCRASCGARKPRRENVVFFASSSAAEQAGFRPCKRCHPRAFEELLEKRWMEEEFKVAAEIQQRLLPGVPPDLPGWEITGLSIPSRRVSGDYYDFIRRNSDDHLRLALGDVAGKGIGAALLMSSVHAALRAQAQSRTSLGEVMAQVNNYMQENTAAETFVTLFYAELDLTAGALEYSNAGHPPPLLQRRSGELQWLTGRGLPLGLFPAVVYRTSLVALEPGDTLVLYSDGITEATNEAGVEFGPARLRETVDGSPDCEAVGLRRRIEEALLAFAGGSAPRDDRTLMVLRRAGEQEKQSSRVPVWRSQASDRVTL